MVLALSSCSLAGSWVYERLDGYIADYFKEFADFTKAQNQEIDRVSEEFLDWFSINELEKVRLFLNNLKTIDIENPENEIKLAYIEGEALFKRINQYFEKPIINFSRGLSEKQINEIAQHFEEIRDEREKERAKDKKEYKERILDNYISGFDRIGINLRKDQIDELKLRLSKHQEIRQEWSDLQQLWINEFIQLLRNRNSPDYEKEMIIYLNAFDSLGSDTFRAKVEQNENLAIDVISFVFKSSDDSQIKGFNRSLDIYLKSIDRILVNRKVN
jgi:hypothetical protein